VEADAFMTALVVASREINVEVPQIAFPDRSAVHENFRTIHAASMDLLADSVHHDPRC
jgi:hypothetical protein